MDLRDYILTSAVIPALLLASCDSVPERGEWDDPSRTLELIDRVSEKVCGESAAAQWRSFSEGAAPFTGPVMGSRILWLHFENLREWRKLPDPVLSRMAESAFPLALQARLQEMPGVTEWTGEAIGIFNSYRPIWESRQRDPSDLDNILRTEPERSKRRLAWMGRRSELGRRMEPALTKLIESRRRAAPRLGYENFFFLCADANGFDTERTDSLLAELEKKTALPGKNLARLIEEKLGTDRLEPWDIYANHFHLYRQLEKTLPSSLLLEHARKTFVSLGFDPKKWPVGLDATISPGSSPHSFVFPVLIPVDVRLLIHPGSGLKAYKSAFHELGHFLYYTHVDTPSFLLRLPRSKAYSESMGKLFERYVYRGEWHREIVGAPRDVVEGMADLEVAEELFLVRLFLAEDRFEREIYEGPRREDLSGLYAEILEETAFITVDEGDRGWASTIHFATHPFSRRDYLLARLIQAQVDRCLRKRFGTSIDSRVADYLIENLYRHGSTRPWEILLEEMTGCELAIEPYLEDVLRLEASPPER